VRRKGSQVVLGVGGRVNSGLLQEFGNQKRELHVFRPKLPGNAEKKIYLTDALRTHLYIPTGKSATSATKNVLKWEGVRNKVGNCLGLL